MAPNLTLHFIPECNDDLNDRSRRSLPCIRTPPAGRVWRRPPTATKIRGETAGNFISAPTPTTESSKTRRRKRTKNPFRPSTSESGRPPSPFQFSTTRTSWRRRAPVSARRSRAPVRPGSPRHRRHPRRTYCLPDIDCLPQVSPKCLLPSPGVNVARKNSSSSLTYAIGFVPGKDFHF